MLSESIQSNKISRDSSGLTMSALIAPGLSLFGVVQMVSKIKTKCPVCGIVFMARKSHYDRNGGKAYCSRKCYYRDIPRKRYVITCVLCGKIRILTPKQYGKRKGLFCSVACRILFQSGPDHPMWKGGQYIKSKAGYVMQYVKPKFHKRQHRIVMEDAIGRELSEDELVHHLNGKKQDNRIENLQIVSKAQHIKIHDPRKWRERTS